MSDDVLKPVDWIGSSDKDFRAFPNEVQDHMGYALHLAQTGAKHEDAKPLKGFGGAGVLEKTGSKTPVADMELIARRLKAAEADYKGQLAKGKRS